MPTIKVETLKPISEIKRVYSGRPGCACGCRGTYYPSNSGDTPSKKDLRMFKRVQTMFQKNLSNAYTWEETKDQFIALDALDTPATRTYTIYYV